MDAPDEITVATPRFDDSAVASARPVEPISAANAAATPERASAAAAAYRPRDAKANERRFSPSARRQPHMVSSLLANRTVLLAFIAALALAGGAVGSVGVRYWLQRSGANDSNSNTGAPTANVNAAPAPIVQPTANSSSMTATPAVNASSLKTEVTTPAEEKSKEASKTEKKEDKESSAANDSHDKNEASNSDGATRRDNAAADAAKRDDGGDANASNAKKKVNPSVPLPKNGSQKATAPADDGDDNAPPPPRHKVEEKKSQKIDDIEAQPPGDTGAAQRPSRVKQRNVDRIRDIFEGRNPPQ